MLIISHNTCICSMLIINDIPNQLHGTNFVGLLNIRYEMKPDF